MTDDIRIEIEQLKKDVFSDDWEIFRILFYETYESKISAYAILSNQIFDFTKEDLIEIQNMWNDCKQHPDKCPCYDDLETREMMQDAVDGFMNAKTKRKPSS